MKKLDQHQIEAVIEANKYHRGIIQRPTGAGKTLIQAEIVAQLLCTGKFSITLVKAPRIMLANQLAKEYTLYLNDRLKDPQCYVSFLVHSGERSEILNEDDLKGLSEEEMIEALTSISSSIDSLTDRREIANKIKWAKKNNKPLVIFTTYHSNLKVIDTIREVRGLKTRAIDLDLNDEGHNLRSSAFHPILTYYNPARQYHFTATLSNSKSSSGRGMNNPIYGGVISSMTAAEAISKGLILPLKTKKLRSKLRSSVDQNDLDGAIGESIEECFEHQEKEFPTVGVKLIVSCTGAKQIKDFISSKNKERVRLQKRGIEILTVHSNKDLVTHNGKKITRNEFERMKIKLGENPNAKVIIVHYNILSEGIDVPGLTGALILRNMSLSTFVQTVGRIVRILRSNPNAKKYGVLYYPTICDPDMAREFDERIHHLYQEGYIPTELLEEYNAKGEGDEDGDDLRDPIGGNSPTKELFIYVDELQDRFDEADSPWSILKNYV
jgi:superfamily II DNA or RNA helicase